jgi:hypothetical protein
MRVKIRHVENAITKIIRNTGLYYIESALLKSILGREQVRIRNYNTITLPTLGYGSPP